MDPRARVRIGRCGLRQKPNGGNEVVCNIRNKVNAAIGASQSLFGNELASAPGTFSSQNKQSTC